MTCPAVAQLSFAIHSPTLHVAVVEDGAGVKISSRNRNAVRPVPRSIGVVEGVEVGVGPTVAQLSVSVSSPTLQVAVVKNGAGVIIPVATATAVRPVPRLIDVDGGVVSP